MNGFKAIPTTYNGMVFRSRFESEAAMLLDKLGLQWEYEPKSFLLPGGHYMPDFFVPSMSMWVEVRGYNGKDWQIDQFREHLRDTDQSFIVFKGDGLVRIVNTSHGIIFNERKMGSTIYVYSSGGHLMVQEHNGRTQTIMEWPGFPEMPDLDLANVLMAERSTGDLAPLEDDFYSVAMAHLNELSLSAKNEIDDLEKQILSDVAKSERNALAKLVDHRIKKIIRRALRLSRSKEDALADGMTPEEFRFLTSVLKSLGEVRESIYSNAFQSNEGMED